MRSVTHEVMLEIRDIDEVTTKEEMLESLNKFADSMKDISISDIKSLRRACGNTQTALLSLSAPLANALLTMAKNNRRSRRYLKLQPKRKFLNL